MSADLSNKQDKYNTGTPSLDANYYTFNSRISVGDPPKWSNLPTTSAYGILISQMSSVYGCQFYYTSYFSWYRLYNGANWENWIQLS